MPGKDGTRRLRVKSTGKKEEWGEQTHGDLLWESRKGTLKLGEKTGLLSQQRTLMSGVMWTFRAMAGGGMQEQGSAERRNRRMSVCRTMLPTGMDVPWIWERMKTDQSKEGCTKPLSPAALLSILWAGTYILGKLGAFSPSIKTILAYFRQGRGNATLVSLGPTEKAEEAIRADKEMKLDTISQDGPSSSRGFVFLLRPPYQALLLPKNPFNGM